MGRSGCLSSRCYLFHFLEQGKEKICCGQQTRERVWRETNTRARRDLFRTSSLGRTRLNFIRFTTCFCCTKGSSCAGQDQPTLVYVMNLTRSMFDRHPPKSNQNPTRKLKIQSCRERMLLRLTTTKAK